VVLHIQWRNSSVQYDGAPHDSIEKFLSAAHDHGAPHWFNGENPSVVQYDGDPHSMEEFFYAQDHGFPHTMEKFICAEIICTADLSCTSTTHSSLNKLFCAQKQPPLLCLNHIILKDLVFSSALESSFVSCLRSPRINPDNLLQITASKVLLSCMHQIHSLWAWALRRFSF
jgi:hypothetical protein